MAEAVEDHEGGFLGLPQRGEEGRRALWDNAESAARHKGRREVFQWMWHAYSPHHTQRTVHSQHIHTMHTTHTLSTFTAYTYNTHMHLQRTQRTHTLSAHTHIHKMRERERAFIPGTQHEL